MTQLTVLKPGTLAKTASAECSAELWRQLTEYKLGGWYQAIDDLVSRPRHIEEIRAVLPALQRHAEPCGDKAVIALLVPLATLYGVSDKSEQEWKVFWRFYVEALCDLPLEAVRAGVDEYVRAANSEFFPKPGPLKALCDKHAAPILTAARRAAKALERAQ